jgi:hypothetical protein
MNRGGAAHESPTLRWSRRPTSNEGLEPTPSSVRCAPASGRGSGLAFGCAETNRHDVKECKSPTVKV